MKPFIPSNMLLCNYDDATGNFTINYEGGSFTTPSEEVFVNQLHKMLGAPHQSADVALLNKHVIKQQSFPLQHLTLRLAYVVKPLDFSVHYQEDSLTWPAYYEVVVYHYGARKIMERSCYRTKDAASKVYKTCESWLSSCEFDIQSFID